MYISVAFGGVQASICLGRNGGNVQDKPAGRDFFEVCKSEIERRRGTVAASTVENEKTALRSFMAYAGKGTGRQDVTPERIRGYEKWLAMRHVSPNTSSCYMRSLRALFNRMGMDGARIFSGVRTCRMRAARRAVDSDDVRKIRSARLGNMHALVRELFIFCIFAMGMPLIDLAFLRREDVRDGYIVYSRHKTDRPVRVRIEPCMQQVIDRFGSTDGHYLFPLLTDTDPERAMRQYARLLPRYNRALAAIARQAGVCTRVTSYTARHTWATMAYKNGTPLAAISQALGHASPLTTQNYLKEMDDETVARANKRIIMEMCGQS